MYIIITHEILHLHVILMETYFRIKTTFTSTG